MQRAPKQKHRFASIAEIGDHKFLIRQISNESIGVIRMKDGTYRAVRNHCPHKGAPICRGTVSGTWPASQPGELDYGREGEILACPWHGFEYDLLTGQELYRKVPTRLRFYDVEVQGSDLFVTV